MVFPYLLFSAFYHGEEETFAEGEGRKNSFTVTIVFSGSEQTGEDMKTKREWTTQPIPERIREFAVSKGLRDELLNVILDVVQDGVCILDRNLKNSWRILVALVVS